MSTPPPPYVTIGQDRNSVRSANLGIGASAVSQLMIKYAKGVFTIFKNKDGYCIPTVVTITEVVSKDTVKVKDIFGREYLRPASKLEPVLYDLNGFEFYAKMQQTAKQYHTEM